MVANFHHGVETIEYTDGALPVRLVKSAVIGLVGTAPAGAFNEPVRLINEKDKAQFGPDLAGFSIPNALNAWTDGGAGTVIAINVLDPATHKSAAADESVTFDAVTGKAQLAHGAISELVLSDGASTTYVLDTDYKILDELNGEIQAISGGAITYGSSQTANYNYLDPSLVDAEDIIGAVDVDGNRSGIEAFRNCFNQFGFNPKILIAPGYSSQASVRAALEVMADALRAIEISDAPLGTTVADAIAGRGPSGSVNLQTSNHRTALTFPYIKTGSGLEPYSQRLAATICKTDLEKGFWYSPSNKEIPGAIGMEIPITGAVNASGTEADALNEAGIITVLNSFGTGFRAWGNRSAAYPSDTHPLVFLCVRRTADMIEESLELASLPFVDLPGSPAMITSVIESGKQYIRTLIQRGAILDGDAWWDPAENPQTNLANGLYSYCYDFMPPTPQERMRYIARINMNYLTQLAAQMAA